MALTRKGAPFVWTYRQQTAFEALKACLISAPILGFPTEDGRFLLDTDASLFAAGGVLNQSQNDQEVVIAYASRNLRLSQWRYCMTRREMLAAVVMCTHFRSYIRICMVTISDHPIIHKRQSVTDIHHVHIHVGLLFRTTTPDNYSGLRRRTQGFSAPSPRTSLTWGKLPTRLPVSPAPVMSTPKVAG